MKGSDLATQEQTDPVLGPRVVAWERTQESRGTCTLQSEVEGWAPGPGGLGADPTPTSS